MSRATLASRIKRELQVSPVDTKRQNRPRGTEAWFRYYAGFNEDFVHSILGSALKNQMLTVLDPWNGSGTTTHVAHVSGHKAIGFDINPVSCILACAKLAHRDDVLSAHGLMDQIRSLPVRKVESGDPLRPWLSESLICQYRTIESGILESLACPNGKVLNPLQARLPPLASFLMLALINVTRENAAIARGTNPTWIRPRVGRRRNKKDLGSLWMSRAISMAASAAGVNSPFTGIIDIGDSRRLSLDDKSIDIVVTSPPYCTRIDYVVSTSFELAALGMAWESDLTHSLRRNAMGTPLARRDQVDASFPSSVENVLDKIRSHPSKSSSSYYYKTYKQYFTDAAESLSEIRRVLKPTGAAVLVVQTSYYKEVPVDLPELYISLAEKTGLTGSVLSEREVTHHLAQINRNHSKYARTTGYRESVIIMETK